MNETKATDSLELMESENIPQQDNLSSLPAPNEEYSDLNNSSAQYDGSLWPPYCNPNYIMPDVIEVKVTNNGLDTYFFPVSVIKASKNKLYLGGYRNKINGIVYHHASTQTPTEHKKKQKDYDNLRTRETQTVETKTLSVQPHRETGTQMERIDLRLNNKRDNVKYSKPYFTSQELLIKKKACVITMQRYWRGYRARCRAAEIRQRMIDYHNALKNQQKNNEEKHQEQKIRDMMRRTHPKSNQDFAVLYNELDIWRKNEIAKIKVTILLSLFISFNLFYFSLDCFLAFFSRLFLI
jgi:hypothetical protein